MVPHQDATFLYTDPVPAVGFWIALEDATIQNGCLWMARGSHKSGVHRRLIRNPDKEANKTMIFDKGEPVYPNSSFTPVPVSKGQLTCFIQCQKISAFLIFLYGSICKILFAFDMLFLRLSNCLQIYYNISMYIHFIVIIVSSIFQKVN